MPVYLRKDPLVLAPPSISELPEDDADDYLLDPDQLRDVLPQPFRMINKTLNKLVDEAWEIIASRETKRVEEANKIRPPQYECGVQLQDYGGVCCMCSTPDGALIIIGNRNGLVAVDTTTQHSVATWEQEGMQINVVHAAKLTDNVYMVSAITDMGMAILFAIAGGMILQLQVLTEQEGAGKLLASKCESSSTGDYVGVYLENAQGKEGVLEVLKCPRDVWLKEIEGIVDKAAAASNKQQAGDQEIPPGTPQQDSDEAPADTAPGGSEHAQDDEQRSQSSGSPRGQGSPRHMTFKFTPASVVLKVKPPEEVKGINWSSPGQFLKNSDHGEVLGTGSNHSISVQHLEYRMEMFKQANRNYWEYLPKEEKHVSLLPTFHFLTPGRILPQGLDNAAAAGLGQPNAIAVWWSKHYQLCQYLLVKTSKDLEHRPDVVWPYANNIVASAVSPDSSLLCVALQNGTVVITDKYHALQRRIVNIGSSSEIQQVSFLDPSVCPQDARPYPPYPTSTNVYVLVWCKDGALHLVNGGLWNQEVPSDVSAELENEGQTYTRVVPIDGIPELVLTVRQNGTVFIHDILSGHVLCEVTLPASHQVASPWEPITATGSQGQLLYITGQVKDSSNSAEGTNHTVFIFQLRSFPTLDSYNKKARAEVPYTVHTTVENRLDALLRHRISKQEERKNRLQKRWFQMKDTLKMIQDASYITQQRQELRKTFNVPTSENLIIKGID